MHLKSVCIFIVGIVSGFMCFWAFKEAITIDSYYVHEIEYATLSAALLFIMLEIVFKNQSKPK